MVERVMVQYRKADGAIVLVDDTAAKGAGVIDYALADGRIVSVYRVVEYETEAMDRHAALSIDAIDFATRHDSPAEAHRAYLHARWSARLGRAILEREDLNGRSNRNR